MSMYSAALTAEIYSCSAGSARAEGRTIGFALGAGLFVLHAYFFSAAVIVDGVVLAAGNIAGNTGVLVVLFVVHIISLP